MKLAWLSLLLPLIAFAGCTGDDAPPTTPTPTEPHGPAEEPPMVIPWSVFDCQFVMAVIPVPAASLSDHVPAGFALVSSEAMGLPDDPRGDGLLGVEAELCPSGEGLNGTIEPTSLGSFWTPVEPPPLLKTSPYSNATADMYIVKWEFSFPDAQRRQMLEHEGIPVREGTARFTMPVPGTGPFTAELVLDGGQTFEWSGAGATDSYVASNFRNFTCQAFTPVRMGEELAGYARWETRFRADGAGQVIREYGGSVNLPAGSLAAQIAGEGQHLAYMLVGVGSYTEAKLYVPHGEHEEKGNMTGSHLH